MTLKVVGNSLHHDSSPQQVAGNAPYIDDLAEPAGMLHAALGLAGAQIGPIQSLDLSAVKAAPGVVRVFTAADIPGSNNAGAVAKDDPLLADGEVQYAQQPVFLVVATSRELARRAARLAKIEVSARRPIVELEQAIEADYKLHEDLNIVTGDAKAAIEASDYRLDFEIKIGGQEHMYLEGMIALADPSPDGLLILSSTQHPTGVQELAAQALGLSSADITVEVRRMGGAFGGKESQGAHPAILAALAATQLGRPVKLRLDRDDDMVTTGKRHDFLAQVEVGFDDQGLITGADLMLASRGGFSQDLTRSVNDRAAFHCENAYFLPSSLISSRRYKTDTLSNTAFRGFGGPQGMIVAERMLDKIAAKVGRDPLDVRLDNLYGERGTLTPYEMHVTEGVLRPMIEMLAHDCDYCGRRAEIAAHNASNPRKRRGLALTPVKFGISFTSRVLNQAGALVHVYKDGSVQVNHGGSEMGQGLHIKVVAVVAEVFGISPDQVKITATRTDKIPNTSPTAASAGSDLNGMAAKNACDQIRDRMAAYVAGKFGAEDAGQEVQFVDGQVLCGCEAMTFAQVALECWLDQISLSSTGFYATPGIGWDPQSGKGRPFFYFANAAACSEVEVDTVTGEYVALRTDILHEVGRSLNPEIDRGQIEGGFIQGQGWLTTEELVYADDGRLLTHAPSTYKIPTARDRPREFNLHLFDHEAPEPTIYRSKAVGEPPLMLANSVHGAIADAIAGLYPAGQWPDLSAPATAEQVLRCIEQARD